MHSADTHKLGVGSWSPQTNVATVLYFLLAHTAELALSRTSGSHGPQQEVQLTAALPGMQISFLKWRHSDTGLIRDGKWSCGSTAFEYPSMHHSLLHPCAHAGGGCCNNSAYAPFLLRYESFFHSRQALLVLAYEVRPHAVQDYTGRHCHHCHGCNVGAL